MALGGGPAGAPGGGGPSVDPTIDPETGKKTDYYKLLGLDGWPGDAAAKKAYYRAAMRMHPDRNQDDRETAEALFKYLQEAWTTLSDPTERAWYDRHKAEVLSLVPATDEFFGVDTHVNLRVYRSSSCYTGMNDTPQGFYGVYSMLFATLAAEEIRAARSRIERGSYMASELERLRLKAALSLAGMPGVTLDPGCRTSESGPSPYTVFPGFGASGATRAEVNRFYAYWSTFTSVKEFSHLDIYETRGEPSKIRRAAQAENERMRQDGREKFSERVRELVAYVKRRDPRLPAFEEEQRKREQEERERAEKEQERKKQARREERERLRDELRARAAELKVKLENGTISPYEMQELERLVVTGPAASDRLAAEMEAGHRAQQSAQARPKATKPEPRKLEAERAEALATISKEARAQGMNYDPAGGRFFCSICNQRVQTEGEFNNHLLSKRHKRALAEGGSESTTTGKAGKAGKAANTTRPGKAEKAEKAQPGAVAAAEEQEVLRVTESTQSLGSLESLQSLEEQLSAIGKRKRRRREESDDVEDYGGSRDTGDAGDTRHTEGNRRSVDQLGAPQSPPEREDGSSDTKRRETGKKGRRRANKPGADGGGNDVGAPGNPAAKPGPSDEQETARRAEPVRPTNASQKAFKCLVCGASFDSRTKMFKHVREEGHAAPKY